MELHRFAAMHGVLGIAVLFAMLLPSAFAADEQSYLVLYEKFKPGKAPEGIKMIKEHFIPTDRKVGRKVIPFFFDTGEWDAVAFFPYDAGRKDTIPGFADWWAALAELEGGQEQAKKLFDHFMDLHSNTKSEISSSPGQIMPGK